MKLNMVSGPKVLSSSPGFRDLLKIVGSPPLCPRRGLLSHTRVSRRRSLPVARVDLSSPSHVRGGVTVYVDCTSPFHQFGLLVALASA